MLNQSRNKRGFTVISNNADEQIIKESSAVGDYKDSYDNPGSSYLWVSDQQVDRKEAKQLIKHLKHWLKNKTLFIDGDKK